MNCRTKCVLITAIMAGIAGANAGCNENGGGVARTPLFGAGSGKGEMWTILCRHYDARQAPDHADVARRMGDMLRSVAQIKPDNVRIDTTGQGSSIYYGRYRKVASPDTGRLIFPAEFQWDIEFIRSLSYERYTPFLHAKPELLGEDATQRRGPFHVSNARSSFSLLVGRFYNTDTFDQRVEVAEQYTKQLRDEGFTAFYDHQQVRSFVYVGEFNEEDHYLDARGLWQLGPRVEALIARKPQEFQYVLDNGYVMKRVKQDGAAGAERSYIVNLKRDHDEDEVEWRRATIPR